MNKMEQLQLLEKNKKTFKTKQEPILGGEVKINAFIL